ncbi:MAG: hypothetical protein PWP46_311 [Fusobacteriaceae bacterium]|jgi:hypothetical protein|nr:hypothetical protein [Fusobacteriaceae bacterium]
MKKRLFIVSVLILAAVTTTYASRGIGMMSGRGYNRIGNERFTDYNLNTEEGKKLLAYEKELKEKYGLKDTEKLNYKKLTDKELEELGDLVMEVMVPDEERHEFMDKMMGGEGSEHLKFAHINMAINYLEGYGFGMMGNGGMMGENYYRNDRALDILKERYAAGEITKEEYEEMKKELTK